MAARSVLSSAWAIVLMAINIPRTNARTPNARIVFPPNPYAGIARIRPCSQRPGNVDRVASASALSGRQHPGLFGFLLDQTPDALLDGEEVGLMLHRQLAGGRQVDGDDVLH